jgi:aconitate hydratase
MNVANFFFALDAHIYSNTILTQARQIVAPRLKRTLATQVPMSLLEKDKFINYKRIEDNLKIVRDRYSESDKDYSIH